MIEGNGRLETQESWVPTMQRLLISYDLLEPNRTKADRDALYAELNSLGAVQIQNAVWAVRTEKSVPHLLADLQGYFGPKDRFLVAHAVETLSRNGIRKLPRV